MTTTSRVPVMKEWTDDSTLSKKRTCFAAGRWFLLVDDPLISEIFTFEECDNFIRGCITLRSRRTIQFFRRLLPDAHCFFTITKKKLKPLQPPAWCMDVWREAEALVQRGTTNDPGA
jgi:hypothetical protein